METKAGASLTSWIFGTLLIILILILVTTQILGPMNTTYNESFDTGLSTDALDDYQEAIQGADEKVKGGEVTQVDQGLSLKEAGSIGKTLYSTIWNFVTGGFIDNLLTDVLGFPAIVGTVIRLMFITSLIFIIVYLFTKAVL